MNWISWVVYGVVIVGLLAYVMRPQKVVAEPSDDILPPRQMPPRPPDPQPYLAGVYPGNYPATGIEREFQGGYTGYPIVIESDESYEASEALMKKPEPGTYGAIERSHETTPGINTTPWGGLDHKVSPERREELKQEVVDDPTPFAEKLQAALKTPVKKASKKAAKKSPKKITHKANL